MMNEQPLEVLCLAWFQDAGRHFVNGPDMATKA